MLIDSIMKKIKNNLSSVISWILSADVQDDLLLVI